MDTKVAIDELKVGMYVARLDRPWLGTPFLLEGLLIESSEDIAQLGQYCKHVYVHGSQGDHGVDPTAAPTRNGGRQNAADAAFKPTSLDSLLPAGRVPYETTVAVEEETPVAVKTYAALRNEMHGVFGSVLRGTSVDVSKMAPAVTSMIESVIRNPDATSRLLHLRTKDEYTFAHCLDSAALAICFGRHLSLPKPEIETLAWGALMCDVGKLRLPTSLLRKPERLTAKEFEAVKQHVRHSTDIMSDTPGIPDAAIRIARTHHERIDGSGYPDGLTGSLIPIYGQIAAIVDTYDAMLSKRSYATAVPAHRAVSVIYGLRGTAFHDALVEQFLQCIGTYPVGTLVELSTGEVGIVVRHNMTRRLRPRVILILDPNKQRYPVSPMVDLMTEMTGRDGKPLHIATALERGAHGINPEEYYL